MKNLNINPIFATDGAQGFEKYSQQDFDLVFMDIAMPHVGGIEATAKIRKHEIENNLSSTPIIALTANSSPADIQLYLSSGFDGHLAKPINISEVKSTIRSILQES